MRLAFARVALAALLIGALFAAGCGGSSEGDKSSSTGGAVLRIGQPPFSALDTTNFFASGLFQQFQQVYPTLVRNRQDLRGYEPNFATSWKVSADGKTWTFTTQPNAKWSDGKPLTARDVAFTINTIVTYKEGGAAGVAPYTVPSATKATALDDTTLEVEFDTASASILDGLAQTFILPEHVWSRYASGPAGRNLTTFKNPAPMVSGGPFIWQRYEPGQFSYFVRNPNWYGPKPKLRAFGIQAFSDEDAMITALESGQIDAVDYLSPGNLTAIADARSVKPISVPGQSVDHLLVNANDKQTKWPALKEPDVLRALDMAIDRDQIVDLVYGGNAAPGNSLVPAASRFHDDAIETTPFDIDGANALLDGLGYKRGGDGIRVADGKRMSFPLVFPGFMRGAGDREFEIIRQGAEKVGIELKKQSIDGPAALDAITGPDGKFLNMAFAIGTIQPAADPSGFTQTFTCGALAGNSRTGMCDPAYDRLWDKQQGQLKQSARQETLNEMQAMLAEQRPFIATVYPNWASAATDSVTGIDSGPLGWYGISNWSLLDVDKQ